MRIREDIENLKALWRSLAPLGKIIIASSLLLSVLSVGSLADTVYQWKGFVLDAVNFYQILTEPIVQVFGLLPVELIPWFPEFNEAAVDLLVVFLLLLSAMMRAGRATTDVSQVTYRSFAISALAFLLFSALVFAIFAAINAGLSLPL